MADLTQGRGAARSVVTPYTEEIQVATFLVDAWMMKMLPLELVGEFVQRTNRKLYQEFTGEKDEEDDAPAPAPAPAPAVSATPMFGGGGGFGSTAYAGSGFGLAAPAAAPVAAPPKPAPAPKVEERKPPVMDANGDVEMEVCEEAQDWDDIEFSTQDLQEIRDSILVSLKKEPFRRLFFELLPKAERYPYLCVKKGAATHADVMLEMLRRNGAIVF